MKKKILITAVCAVVVILAVLFVPIPTGGLNDGGTKEYVALTYKVIKWNKIVADSGKTYSKTCVYFGSYRNKTYTELWKREAENIEYTPTVQTHTDEWINKETAEKIEGQTSFNLVITEIYSDYFFAKQVLPMSYTIKVNGSLSEDWCVGDRVRVSCDHYYIGDDSKMEFDMTSIDVSTFEPEPIFKKPVIYLYPEEETEVSVNLTLDGKLTCTYPSYGNGWTVTASPDGTLKDKNGKTYNYLYWEGETKAIWDMSRGFCVKGEDTAVFLEDALERLGLNRREANEFIVYWLPLMQENEYNIITFQTDAYTDTAVLGVTPNPDTVIRVFMAYMATDEYVEIEEQELTAPERNGFTVVEWGGTEVKQ